MSKLMTEATFEGAVVDLATEIQMLVMEHCIALGLETDLDAEMPMPPVEFAQDALLWIGGAAVADEPAMPLHV